MRKPVVIGLAVVVLVTVVAGGYQQYQSRQDNDLTLYGNVDIRTTSLSFCIEGHAESLAVDEGDVIKTDQVLDELDHKPYEIALMQTKAGVSVAQVQYDLMLVGHRDEKITQVAAAVKQAQAAYGCAQSFYNRQQGLWKGRTISASDLEDARSSRNQAQATLGSARDKLRQYRSGNREQDIAQAKTNLGQTQVQLAQTKLNLQDLMLVTPSDSTLLTRAIRPNTVLNENGTIFTVSLTCPTWIRTYTDECNLDQAQLGCRVLLYTDSHPDRPYHGQISLVSPIAEFTLRTVEAPDLCTDLVYHLRIVVTDAGDALYQGTPVTVQFGDEAEHE